MKLKGKASVFLLIGVAAATTLACPIQRAPVPPEYMGFRAQLQDAVTDTARVEMEGLARMQERLEIRLTDLAAILTVDSLLTALDADRELAPLSGAIATTVRIQLEAKGVDGGVRKAYRNPDGQRQAVDAIVIGLGRALYRVRSSRGASLGGSNAVGQRVRHRGHTPRRPVSGKHTASTVI
jgi:hypothetical protein